MNWLPNLVLLLMTMVLLVLLWRSWHACGVSHSVIRRRMTPCQTSKSSQSDDADWSLNLTFSLLTRSLMAPFHQGLTTLVFISPNRLLSRPMLSIHAMSQIILWLL